MKGKRCHEQIVYAFKSVEGGAKANEVCRQLGVSEAASYQWKKKYAGLSLEPGEDKSGDGQLPLPRAQGWSTNCAALI